MVASLVPLETLGRDEWAEIAEIDGLRATVARLAELGLRVGSRLRMLQPGYPCLFQLGSSRLSLRGDDALRIFVRPVEAEMSGAA